MKIDFISDVACPWCAIGLNALEQALTRIGDELPVTLAFQPFELNPQMAPVGEDAGQHLSRKYGMNAEQLQAARERVRARGAEVGFAFGDRLRVWNTFDAHRLLHWAGVEGPPGAQRALKHALLEAYHGQGKNPSDADVLAAAAVAAGLPEDRAREVIRSGAFTDEVRKAERHWQELGISAVPSVVVDGKHLIQGGQPPEVFEQALRQIAAGG